MEILGRFGTLLTLVGLVVLAPVAGAQESAPDITSDVRQDGEFISVSAQAELAVPRPLAFAVLTDYERFPEFLPDLTYSRVALRQGTGVVLEQKGTMKFLFFSQPVNIRLAVVESFPMRVVSHSLGGSLRHFTGRYDLLETAGGVRINYSARFIPAFVLPEFLGTFIVRSVFVKNFAVMLQEMQRRDALKRPRTGAPSAGMPATAVN